MTCACTSITTGWMEHIISTSLSVIPVADFKCLNHFSKMSDFITSAQCLMPHAQCPMPNAPLMVS